MNLACVLFCFSCDGCCGRHCGIVQINVGFMAEGDGWEAEWLWILMKWEHSIHTNMRTCVYTYIYIYVYIYIYME